MRAFQPRGRVPPTGGPAARFAALSHLLAASQGALPAPLFGEGTGRRGWRERREGSGEARRWRRIHSRDRGAGQRVQRRRPDPQGDQHGEKDETAGDRGAARRGDGRGRRRHTQAEAAGGRPRGAGARGLTGRPSRLGPRAPRALSSRSPSRSPGRDVGHIGANELEDLSITSPEPAAIGWPSRRGGLLL